MRLLPALCGPLLAAVFLLAACDTGPEVCEDGELATEDLRLGVGDTARASSTVNINFVGRLGSPTGEIFGDGDDVTFDLDEAIAGFRQGMVGMREGGERRITVPPNLGYGNVELPAIPACSTLIFDVELIEVDPD
ncbi:MAG TPA: FKBP-type peptidyl-prolyl cis-trans isomerase [Rubricoccaceae bacterium]|nr:FKBP-type peptidyl-prolyl cis-trans isomerase [Rubricoccaceae bacterium]